MPDGPIGLDRHLHGSTARVTIDARRVCRPGLLTSALLAGWLMSAAARPAEAGADGPAPLFLAPRDPLADHSDALVREGRRRQQARIVTISNPRLKWQPRRQASSEAASQTATPTSAERPAADEPVVVASRIATSDAPPRVKTSKRARAEFRDQVLRVNFEADPDEISDDPFSDTPMRNQPARRPARGQDLSDETPEDEAYPRSTTPRATETEPGPLNNGNFMDEELPPIEDPGSLGSGTGSFPTTVSCENDKKECRDALLLLKKTGIERIDINVRITGNEGMDFPCECELGGSTFNGRQWCGTNFTWKASALCHKPLYFEEVGLERYGHSFNPYLQPAVSAAHFFAVLPVLPYIMALHPINECEYALGYYRPGNCAPYMVPPIPISIKAGLVEAAVVAGGIIIIP